MPRHTQIATALLLAATSTATLSAQPARRPFLLEEATIAQIHAAFKAKTLTCRALTKAYLDRIDALDKRGPAINAIVLVNPDALAVADSLDCARNCKHHTKKRTRDCEICVRMSLVERCARRGV